MSHRPTALLAVLLAAATLALAAAPAKPKAKPNAPEPVVDRVAEDDIDKPSESTIPVPAEIPAALKPKAAPKPADPKAKPTLGTGHNPFRKRAARPKYGVACRITYSDGKVLEGFSWRRANGHIRIFNRAQRRHEEIFLSDLKRITVRPETVTFERDWRWKNQGSSEKVFLETGYFWDQYETTMVTTDGEFIKGDCSGQFYFIDLEGSRKNWILNKRLSGRGLPHKKRDELEPLVYIKKVEFTDDFLKKLEAEQKKQETKSAAEKPTPKKE